MHEIRRNDPEYKTFIYYELLRQRQLHPGLKPTEYFKLVAIEWNKITH